MQQQQPTGTFDIEEARRVLADVFAPWVSDLGLSVESIDYDPPPGAAIDWQPLMRHRDSAMPGPRRPHPKTRPRPEPGTGKNRGRMPRPPRGQRTLRGTL